MRGQDAGAEALQLITIINPGLEGREIVFLLQHSWPNVAHTNKAIWEAWTTNCRRSSPNQMSLRQRGSFRCLSTPLYDLTVLRAHAEPLRLLSMCLMMGRSFHRR